ncbi:MAG: sulfite exporter TauE/SafE family protein [Thermaerobacter sp.]|nr:sulfite exporter TauE/SafE family protein [Thermaerobacter sp.]
MTQTLLVLWCIGLVGGVFSGLLGIGGAIILVPMLLYLPPLLGLAPFDMKEVAAMSITLVFFASLSGVLAHGRDRHVNFRLVLVMGVAVLVGALAGAVGSKFVSSEVLMAIFAGLTLLAAALMLRPPARREEEGGPVRFNAPLAGSVAAGIGVLSGMVGVGGGFLLVPVMLLLGVPTRTAIGSSLAMVLLSGAAGMAGKAFTHQVPWLLAGALVVGAMPGAQLGAMGSKRLSPRRLRTILAVVIALIGVKMLWGLVA